MAFQALIPLLASLGSQVMANKNKGQGSAQGIPSSMGDAVTQRGAPPAGAMKGGEAPTEGGGSDILGMLMKKGMSGGGGGASGMIDQTFLNNMYAQKTNPAAGVTVLPVEINKKMQSFAAAMSLIGNLQNKVKDPAGFYLK